MIISPLSWGLVIVGGPCALRCAGQAVGGRGLRSLGGLTGPKVAFCLRGIDRPLVAITPRRLLGVAGLLARVPCIGIVWCAHSCPPYVLRV